MSCCTGWFVQAATASATAVFTKTPPRVAVVDGEVHLTGSRLVLDLGALLDARKTPAAFVVYRESDCADGGETQPAQISAIPSGAEPLRDIIFVVSAKLQGALQRLSRFAPNEGAYGRSQQDNRPSPRLWLPPLSASPSEYSWYFFYHHREAIQKAVTTDPCGGDVKSLLMYVLDSPNHMFVKCDSLFGQGLVTPETLPWLFLPNEVIVRNSGQGDMASVLRHYFVLAGGPGSDSVELSCWNWGFDGRWLRRKESTGTVTTLRAVAAPITQLTAYPLRYADERTKLRLFERGSRFWASRNPTHFSYEGPDYTGEHVYVGSLPSGYLGTPWCSVNESRCAYWKNNGTQPRDSRFMVDHQTYYKFHKNTEAFAFSSRRAVAFDKWPHQISATADLSAWDTMLLLPSIHAFFLQEKTWGMCDLLPEETSWYADRCCLRIQVHLLVGNLAPVDWDRTAFDRLVLPQRIKDLVKALVPRQKAESAGPSANPVQQGKRSGFARTGGRGLIMHLHGPSGTGKTLTAGKYGYLPNPRFRPSKTELIVCRKVSAIATTPCKPSQILTDLPHSLAEVTQLPLYTITRRDISTGSAFDNDLELVVHAVQRWSCRRLTTSRGDLLLTEPPVFLLDQADEVIDGLSLSERGLLVSGTLILPITLPTSPTQPDKLFEPFTLTR